MTDSAAASIGRMMIERGRWQDAESHLREALESDPESWETLMLLTWSLYMQEGKEKEALTISEEVIRLAPDEPSALQVRARVLLRMGNVEAARSLFQRILEIDPDDEDALCGMAQYHAHRTEWKQVETFARQVLERNPEESEALNLFNHSLRMQGKQQESEEHAARLLMLDAGDADHHELAGWNALHKGDVKTAETHFLESLRIHPRSEGAREGLKEAYRSRSLFYRTYFRHLMWMSSFSGKKRWMIVLGMYLCARVIPSFLDRLGLGTLSLAIVFGYLGFVIWLYISRPMGNVLLLMDSKARHALNLHDKASGITVTVLVLTGIAGLVMGMVMSGLISFLAAHIGFLFLGSGMLMTFAFSAKSPFHFGWITLHSIGLVTVALLTFLIPSGTWSILPEPYEELFRKLMISVLIGTFVYQTNLFSRE